MAERDGQHEDAVQHQRIEDAHGGDMLDAVSAEKEQPPAPANSTAAQEAVAFALF